MTKWNEKDLRTRLSTILLDFDGCRRTRLKNSQRNLWSQRYLHTNDGCALELQIVLQMLQKYSQ